jgi:hypothetical protein
VSTSEEIEVKSSPGVASSGSAEIAEMRAEIKISAASKWPILTVPLYALPEFPCTIAANLSKISKVSREIAKFHPEEIWKGI